MKLKKAGGLLLDVLFPKRCPFCGVVQGFAPACGCEAGRQKQRLAASPLPPPRLPAGLALAESYARYRYEEPVRGAILRFKFEGEQELAAPLGDELYAVYESAGLAGRYDVIVPAPISAKRLKKRGYNQSLLLAQRLAGQAGLPLLEAALHKKQETVPQAELARAERLENLVDAFEADAAQVAGKRVLLVDDIITTGSTLNECARALLAAGAATCGSLCLAASLLDEAAETPDKSPAKAETEDKHTDEERGSGTERGH